MSEPDPCEGSVRLGIRWRAIPKEHDYWRTINVLERIVAFVVFGALCPILSIAALTIIVLSRRPPFIAHRRVGQNGREIWVVKLRTMWDSRTASGAGSTLIERISDVPGSRPILKMCRDPRVANSFAAFLRRYSIDELPQLWQVACGQLALVGPRPITRQEIDEYYGPDSSILLSRKPGITGLWQVCGRSRLNYLQRRRLDLFMIRTWSVRLYLVILSRTLYRAPLGKDAW
jgi:exopolysaccharide production protein ExoY